MKKRSIILYWLLLLVPTFIVSILVVQLLRHEQERLDQQILSITSDRINAIADTLLLTIQSVEDNLSNALSDLSPGAREQILISWQKDNSLIRNVFIWHPAKGLLYPRTGREATNEERQFQLKYDALFSGRIQWPSAAENPLLENQQTTDLQTNRRSGFLSDMQRGSGERQKLARLAQPEILAESKSKAQTMEKNSFESGWMPWYEENRLSILGWTRDETGLVYGMELELMTLLSRLIHVFPAPVESGIRFALLDDNGSILHQTGGGDAVAGSKPDTVVSLAPLLPHWQVGGYVSRELIKGGAGQEFFLLTILMLLIFIAAITLGTILITRQLQRSQQDARQKTSFVANVSHELKTPLTSIRMYTELLQSGRIKDTAKQHHYLDVIVTESERLTRLVNNVLDFSRLEQGRKKYQTQLLDLTAQLHKIANVNKPRITAAGLEFIEAIPDQTINRTFDADVLEQVVLNLIDNCIKYAASGGELCLSLEETGTSCQLLIKDRGPGIPTKQQENIFVKFYRLDDSLTAGQPGSGLGLTIARQLMRDMGGDLVYRNRNDGGSCFVAVFPKQIKS